MPLLVRSCHRRRFGSVLRDAFRLERDVFGDGFGDGDADVAGIRLANLDIAGRVTATVRLNPGAANLACGPWPAGGRIVQMSPPCADPRLGRGKRLQALLELRAGVGLLFRRERWTHAVAAGPDSHIQAFVASGMAVQVLGASRPRTGDGGLCFAVLVSDPDRLRFEVGGAFSLQDPDEDSSLFTRFGDRAAA